MFPNDNREDQARAQVFAEAFAARRFDVWRDACPTAGQACEEVTGARLADDFMGSRI
jgi:hypothetical protein